MNTADAIKTQELTRRYANVTAVDELSWIAPEGSACGLLGPNGAGKSTTLKMLMGMVFPDAGNAEVLGFDISRQSLEIRKRVAFVPDNKDLYHQMKAGKFLEWYSRFFPEWSGHVAQELICRWNLPLEKKISELSKGNKSKLIFCAVFARHPQMLLMDEPSEGLDPESIEDLLAAITHWSAGGNRTSILATHRLDEVERICDWVTIIHEGKVQVNENLDDLKAKWKTIQVIGETPVPELKNWKDVYDVRKDGWTTVIISASDAETLAGRLREQFHLANVTVHDMSLREIYLSIVRRGRDYDFLKNME